MNLLFLRRFGHGQWSSSGGGGGLPAGYSRMPYVSCDASYIDTGVYGNASTRIVIKFMCEQRSASSFGIIGAREQDNDEATLGVYCGSGGSGTPEKDYIQFFSHKTPYIRWWNFSVITVDITNKGMHSVEEPGPLHDYVINKYLNWNVSSGRTSKTMYLGGINGDTGMRPTEISHYGRLYSCDIYDNDVLVRSYVPARNDETLEYGLYDTVNGTFNTSIANPFQYNVFSGTATGNFTLKRLTYYNGSYFEYGAVTNVEVTNGTFYTELPLLDPGFRYTFMNTTELTSITQAPILQTPSPVYSGFMQTEISGWSPGSLESTFKGCSNLTSICPLCVGDSKTLTSMFEGCSSLVNAPYMFTDGVKLMDKMFYGCSSLESVPSYDYRSIFNSEPSSTSSLSSMFGLCESLETIEGMRGLQKDVNLRGCVSLSAQSLLNIANTVSVNPRSDWNEYIPELPPTVEGNDTPENYLNIRLSGVAGSTDAGDGSVRVRVYNDDSAKYAEAVGKLAAKGWIVNN